MNHSDSIAELICISQSCGWRLRYCPHLAWGCNVSANPSAHQGLWGSIVTPRASLGDLVTVPTKMRLWQLRKSDQLVCYQFIFRYLGMLQSDLAYSGSKGAIGCICIKFESNSRMRALVRTFWHVWPPLLIPSLSSQSLMYALKHHCSPSLYCKMAISGWLGFPC